MSRLALPSIARAINIENPVDVDSALQQAVTAAAAGSLVKPAHLADLGGYSSYFADPMGISGK